MGKQFRFVIDFSRDIPDNMLEKLKERLETVEKIPEKLAGIFKALDNVKVTIEYDKTKV